MGLVIAGKLRDTITVERINAAAAVGLDGKIDKSNDANWQTYITRRAEVLETGGREEVQGRQIVPGVTHLIRIRLDEETDGIESLMRIKLNGDTLQIAGITRIDRTMEMQCESNRR